MHIKPLPTTTWRSGPLLHMACTSPVFYNLFIFIISMNMTWREYLYNNKEQSLQKSFYPLIQALLNYWGCYYHLCFLPLPPLLCITFIKSEPLAYITTVKPFPLCFIFFFCWRICQNLPHFHRSDWLITHLLHTYCKLCSVFLKG